MEKHFLNPVVPAYLAHLTWHWMILDLLSGWDY